MRYLVSYSVAPTRTQPAGRGRIVVRAASCEGALSAVKKLHGELGKRNAERFTYSAPELVTETDPIGVVRRHPAYGGAAA